jgi:hypothetical protein
MVYQAFHQHHSPPSPLLLAANRKGLHLFDVLFTVVFVQRERLLLSRALDIGFVLQQLLYPQQNLFDCDVWFPIFLFVQNRETNSARGVDVGVR